MLSKQWASKLESSAVLCLQRFQQRLREVVKKKRIFYGQADRKGGGRSATLALTVSKCENFDHFFFLIEYDSMELKTHYTSL